MSRAVTVIAVLFLGAAFSGSAAAGEADVVGVKAHGGGGTYGFDVAVRHADTGWKHYADKWDVLDPDGKVLGTRVLVHPHETEQPFTRGMSGVRVPAGIKRVTLRAHDSVHGYGGKTITVELPGR